MNHYSIIQVQYPAVSDFYFDAAHKKTHHPSYISLHMHDYYEFYIYLSGNIKFLIDNRIYTIKKGEILIIPPYHMHSLVIINNDEPYERMYLYATKNVLSSLPFNQHSILKSLSEITKTRRFFYEIQEPSDFETILYIIDYMHNSKNQNFYNKEVINKSCLTLLITIVNKYIQDETITHKVSETDTLFSKATAYINEHFTGKLSIDLMCTTLFTNRQTLSKLFKNYTNLTLHSYITSLKIARAKQLIVDGEKPSKIYSLCGFNDYTTFYRAFKKIENSTPQKLQTLVAEKPSKRVSSNSFNELTDTTQKELNNTILEEALDNINIPDNYFYINSYLKKHLQEFSGSSSSVIELLQNDLFNYPAYMNKYIVPGYIPAVTASDNNVYSVIANKGSVKTYHLVIPISNTFSLTLIGDAIEPSVIQITIQNKKINPLIWHTSYNSISTKKAFHLSKGTSKLDIEIISGCIELTDIYMDLAPNSSKCNINIVTSSVADGTNSSNIHDGMTTTTWKPASHDEVPWIEFMFSYIFYFDHFSVTGITSHVQDFEIQTNIHGNNWDTVYQGNQLLSGKEIYIHGTKSIKGKRFRILFTKLTGPLEISDMKLSPYINWSREDTGTILSIQESVKKGEEGVIPDLDMTSKYVQRHYILSYLDQSNQWVQSISYCF